MAFHGRYLSFLTLFLLHVSTTSADSSKPEKKFADIQIAVTADESFLPPSAFPVKMDPEVCGTTRAPQSLILNSERGIKNVVVWITGDIQDIWKAEENADRTEIITEEGCEFSPRMTIIPQGGSVTFLNRDKILNGIRAKGTQNPPSYRAHPPNLRQIQIKFEKPEIVPIVCDFHPWMKSFVIVAPHHFYGITNKDGVAQLKKVPEGNFKVHLWHETLGYKEIEQPLQSAGKSLRINWKWTKPEVE
ncbi:MAG: hypothetical protein J0L93_02460 [Deltaproteobacteria bacterium]|nr:hypothetical protein [Deltaproteobacteria bacterium]